VTRLVAARLALALTSAVGTLAVVEAALRVATRTSATGMPLVFGFALLPYRPAPGLVAARIAATRGSTYVVSDAMLGWTVRPDGVAPLYRSNSQGIRTDPSRVFRKELPEDRLRIAAVGDSFVHCDDVPLEATWPYQLERERDDLETLNFGVPGFGTDQAYLRWRRDARPFLADVTILGIWPEDICRNVSHVRYYLNPASDFGLKPRFELLDGSLRLIGIEEVGDAGLIRTLSAPEDDPALARVDGWYSADETTPRWHDCIRTARALRSFSSLLERKHRRDAIYWSETDPAVAVTLAIAERFAADVREQGSIPLVVVFPMRSMLPEIATRGSLPIVGRLAARGVATLDVSPVFAAQPDPATLFTASGHLAEGGNRIVAREILSRIETLATRWTSKKGR
jgi:hypothetical protein